MLIELTGIIEDGSDRDPALPLSARKSISIVQGADVVIRCTVVTASGFPTASIMATYVLSIKRKTNVGFNIKRSGLYTPSVGAGVVTFVLSQNDTRNLTPGSYVYDIWATDGEANAIVPLSECQVEPSLRLIDAPLTPSPIPPAPPGVPGATLSKTAAQALGGHRVVRAVSSDTVDYCDANTLADVQTALGITAHAASAGGGITVVISGEMFEPSWTWTPGLPIFCGANGVLTQSIGAFAWSRIVAVAESATKIFVLLREPVVLS